MQVRDATTDDAEAVRAVHYESILGLGPAKYDETQVEAWAAGCEHADYEAAIADADEFLVAELDDGQESAEIDDHESGIIGFGSMAYAVSDEYHSDGGAEVTGVYVHPSIAGQCVGSALYEELASRAIDRGVETVVLTASAPLYSSTNPTGSSLSESSATSFRATFRRAWREQSWRCGRTSDRRAETDG